MRNIHIFINIINKWYIKEKLYNDNMADLLNDSGIELNDIQRENKELKDIIDRLMQDSEALSKRKASTNRTSKEYYHNHREERLLKQKEYNQRRKLLLSPQRTEVSDGPKTVNVVLKKVI